MSSVIECFVDNLLYTLRLPDVPRAAANEVLRRLLLDPIAEYLPAAVAEESVDTPPPTVIFFPIGSLFLVPFASLQAADDDAPLLRKYKVLHSTSVVRLEASLAQEQHDGRAVVVLAQEPGSVRAEFDCGAQVLSVALADGATAFAESLAAKLGTSVVTVRC